MQCSPIHEQRSVDLGVVLRGVEDTYFCRLVDRSAGQDSLGHRKRVEHQAELAMSLSKHIFNRQSTTSSHLLNNRQNSRWACWKYCRAKKSDGLVKRGTTSIYVVDTKPCSGDGPVRSMFRPAKDDFINASRYQASEKGGGEGGSYATIQAATLTQYI